MSIFSRVPPGMPTAKSTSWYKIKLEGGPWAGDELKQKRLDPMILTLTGDRGHYEKDRCEGEFAIYKWVQS